MYWSSVGCVGTLQLRNVPVAFHKCYYDQNVAIIICNKISKHPFWGGRGLHISWIDYTAQIVMELGKFTDKMDQVHNQFEIINSGIK